MRDGTGRWAAALLLGLAIGAGGCATPDFVGSMLGRPPAASRGDSAQRAYQAGYAAGQRDDQRELRPDYARHQNAYDWSTERAFADGYRDGYGRRDEGYVEAPGRSRSDDDPGEDEDGRGRVMRAVPDWLVGDFRGGNDGYESDVELLSIHPNASVVLVRDGRERQGVYSDGTVRFRHDAYVVTRAHDGIRFTSVDDSRDTVYLRRSD